MSAKDGTMNMDFEVEQDASAASVSQPLIHGIVTALVTPLTEDDRIDESALERLIERQLDAGIHAIFVLGSVGEGPMLTPEMSELTIRRAVDCVNGRVPLLAGASDNSVELVLRRLDMLARLGVPYGVLTLPYYGWSGRREETLEFFRSVARATPVPLIAYNLPMAVGWQIPPDVLEELFPAENIIGIKDTHADCAAMEQVARSPRRPKGFTYLPGNSVLAAGLWKAGANGVVSTPSNIHPKLMVALWDAHMRRDEAELERLSAQVSLLSSVLKLPTGAAGIKCMLEMLGICTRRTIRPWPMANEEHRGQIAAIMAQVVEDLKSLT